jgi:hypothetical protein
MRYASEVNRQAHIVWQHLGWLCGDLSAGPRHLHLKREDVDVAMRCISTVK